MHFVSSLSNAKISFSFPSNIVVWDWSSPSSAVPPHALALATRRKGKGCWRPHGDLYLWPCFSWWFPTENYRKLSRRASFPVLRRGFLVQVDHIKGKAKIQTIWLFGDPPACSYIFLLFKKHVHLITCTTFQNISFSQQKGHVLALMQPQLSWRDCTFYRNYCLFAFKSI